MKITYYEESDVLFIRFTDQPVAKSQTVGSKLTVMDVAEDGTPVSLEIINAAQRGMNIKALEFTSVPDDITDSRHATQREEITPG
ncbi:MAG: DUF2283 domain-containing protein [Anaerolineae bacterium]|nr:DUF2283 domain-containing protein [Anaerolineae bacterium]